MENAIATYFEGERQGAVGFASMGVVACVLAVFVYQWAAHYRAMLYPLLIFAAIQIGVGVFIYLRTPPQVEKLLAQWRDAPSAFRAEEGKRMAGVNRTFALVEVAELVFITTGLVLCFGKRDHAALFAVGLGLILQATALLVGDLAAHRRGQAYARAIEATTAS